MILWPEQKLKLMPAWTTPHPPSLVGRMRCSLLDSKDLQVAFFFFFFGFLENTKMLKLQLHSYVQVE